MPKEDVQRNIREGKESDAKRKAVFMEFDKSIKNEKLSDNNKWDKDFFNFVKQQDKSRLDREKLELAERKQSLAEDKLDFQQKKLNENTLSSEKVYSPKKRESNFVKVNRATNRISGKVERAISRLLKKPILSKPHAKLPVVSNRQLMKSFANSGYTMFKSEPKNYAEQPVQDNRSLFFRSEFNNEKRNMGFRAL